jgi:hypothetical protein
MPIYYQPSSNLSTESRVSRMAEVGTLLAVDLRLTIRKPLELELIHETLTKNRLRSTI